MEPIIFEYTGELQLFTIPSGVHSITVSAVGARGAPIGGPSSKLGGYGASITGTFTVTPGETLSVLVGGAGGDGPIGLSGMGGGGGGGSFVWRGSDYTSISKTLLVAAGGGGGSGYSTSG